jgi:hypothetical protein
MAFMPYWRRARADCLEVAVQETRASVPLCFIYPRELHMRYLVLTTATALALMLGACSKEEAPPAAPAAEESDGKTTINIDTESDTMTYESEDEDSSTSLSIGEDEEVPADEEEAVQ